MNMKKHLFILFAVCLSLVACKSKQEIVLQPLPYEIRLINDHYYNDDLDALINDYELYPQHKEYICELIFVDYDFSGMSYDEIFFLKEDNVFKPDILEGFKEVLEERKYFILGQLNDMSIDSLYAYYMKHPVQRGFIGEYLDSTILKVMPELEYPDIKYLANLFKGTQVGEKMRQIQQEQKAKKTTILEDLNEYVSSEFSSLEMLKNEIGLYAIQSALNNFEGFMERIMKDNFPKDEKEIEKVVDELIKVSMSSSVEKYTKNKAFEYVNQINETRRFCIISLSDDSVKAISAKDEIFIDENKIKFPLYEIKYNPFPLYEISKKQNRKDWAGYFLSGVSFISNFIPYVKDIKALLWMLDGADMLHSSGREINKLLKINKQVEVFEEDFYKAIYLSASQYSNKITDSIKEELVKSQDLFKDECYEIY